MMLRCDRAALDTDQGILFCDDGGPCGKRLHYDDCPLMSQKENEKSFEIGQRVRIIGPDNFNRLCHLGECFVIEEKDNPAWGWIDRKRPYGYSRHGCPHIFPASSLELVEPEYDCPQGIRCPYIPKSHRLEMVEQRCMTIEKRLQAPEGKANNEVATDISDELPELHVGNYVEVVGQPFVTPGLPAGTIDRVSYQAPFGWFTLEGSEAWYPLRSLRKLSDEEIIAEIGWERKA